MMIALMEKAAALSIEPVLAEGQSSVGMHMVTASGTAVVVD